MSTIQNAAVVMYKHAALVTEEDAKLFDAAILACGNSVGEASVEDVKALLMAFRDDVIHVDVQESLRGLIGHAPKSAYVEALLSSIVKMRSFAPGWTAEIAGFITNSVEYSDALVAASTRHSPKTRETLSQVLQEASTLGFERANRIKQLIDAIST